MDEPITREEMFLAKAAGENVNIPEPITRKEQYLKAIAENGGSGGGGLPAVTSADVGKGLSVQRTQTGTQVLVPEQTVRAGYDEATDEGVDAPLVGANVSLFTVGTVVSGTINGYPVWGVGERMDEGIYAEMLYDGAGAPPEDYQSVYIEIYSETQTLMLVAERDIAAYTVSFNVLDYEQHWVKEYPFDLVVKLDDEPHIATEATLIRGSAKDVITKTQTGEAFSAAIITPFRNVYMPTVMSAAPGYVDISFVTFGNDISFYAATSSGGATSTRYQIPRTTVYTLRVYINGTVSGWWE